ncbi:Dabb family protein [Candidatus Saccharibacteria bacterium]|nr:Dabb family protein [Candidatus Saccharibacteria bacterium]
MFNHIVLFKAKNTATKTEIGAALESLEKLLEEVVEVKTWSVSKVLSMRPSPYDYVQFSVFDNVKGMDQYRHHPRHEQVKAKLKQVFDYEVVDFEA